MRDEFALGDRQELSAIFVGGRDRAVAGDRFWLLVEHGTHSSRVTDIWCAQEDFMLRKVTRVGRWGLPATERGGRLLLDPKAGFSVGHDGSTEGELGDESYRFRVGGTWCAVAFEGGMQGLKAVSSGTYLFKVEARHERPAFFQVGADVWSLQRVWLGSRWGQSLSVVSSSGVATLEVPQVDIRDHQEVEAGPDGLYFRYEPKSGPSGVYRMSRDGALSHVAAAQVHRDIKDHNTGVMVRENAVAWVETTSAESSTGQLGRPQDICVVHRLGGEVIRVVSSSELVLLLAVGAKQLFFCEIGRNITGQGLGGATHYETAYGSLKAVDLPPATTR